MELFKLFGTIAINNEQANKGIDETVGKAERAATSTSTNYEKIGTALTKGAAVVGKGAALAVTAIYGITEATREYRTDMGKLTTAFEVNGHSSETAKKTYKDLQSVLGDSSTAVEAANHLALLCDNEADLQSWTNICTGVFATFGNSLPIEGLTEAANETAKVGTVTGTLADALNWAGISEDAFNAQLASCSSEQERQKLITDTLTGAYSKASEQYQATNKDIIASNLAHDNLNEAMAGLGAAAEPAVTMVINAIASLVRTVTPAIKAISDAVVALGEAWNWLKGQMTNISASIKVSYNQQQLTEEKLGDAIAEATGSELVGDMATQSFHNMNINPDLPIDYGSALNGLSTFLGWKAKGAVFSSPTILNTRLGTVGVGEAGAEAVAPIDVLQGYVAAAVASQNAGIANALERVVEAIESMDANMGGHMRDALEDTSLKVNNREFARMVKAVG